MDELLHHCLRELAFDGDLGSDVTRLKDFIVGFYDQRNALHFQNLDDAFGVYVWSLLVQQSTVVFGVVPEGNTYEVWIAPQVSAKRKATTLGSEQPDLTPPLKLEAIPERKDTSLNVLKERYGGRLRIAANPDVIFSAITGSHLRSTKLSPMVYSALQIITRGRDAGVSVVELGKRSGYDQKTCFYLVKQLIDLDLVLKVRRGGVGTHFVIHKYFYERSCSWNAIREEEYEAENHWMKAEEYDIEGAEKTDLNHFTPIDARHLSSYPLISQRVIKLLRASKNHMHASKDMLVILGFSNPTKTDRRFFKTRINEMVQKGVIEKVIVPNKQKSVSSSVKCFRLTDKDTMNEDFNSAGDDIDAAQLGSKDIVKFDSTIHKQIIDLIGKSGTKGMTLNDLSTSLRNFDKRTIELLLARSERNPPPDHLLDLCIVGIMETSGRERRHRYYTIGHYRRFVNEESLDNESIPYNDMDLDNVGGFSVVDPNAFYETEGDMVRYTSSFNSKHDVLGKKKKTRIYKNPILPDGTVKRGRPRKNPEASEVGVTVKHQGKRRKVENEEEGNKRPSKKVRMSEVSSELPTRAKRGRPPKQKPILPMVVETSIPKRRSHRLAHSPPPADVVHQAATRTSVSPGVLLNNDESAFPPPIENSTDVTSGTGDNLQINELFASPPVAGPVSPNTQRRIKGKNSEIPVSNDVSGSIEQTAGMMSRSHLDSAKPVILPSGIQNRVNISHLRRENEFIRLIEKAGGIIGIRYKEFYEGHMKLLQELSQADEPVSAPVGTKVDKRTMSSTFASLERKGRIKQMKTSTMTPTGAVRAVSLVFLPDIDENRLHRYLCDLGRSSQLQLPHLDAFVKIHEQVDYGAGPSVPRVVPPLQLLQMEKPTGDGKERWSKNLDRAHQLFAHNDPTIRDVFLAERTTMVQLYGFILGKALRCRQLHLSVLEALESHTSSNIVSHEKRIVEISFFTHHIPVDLYCSLVGPADYDEDLLALLASEMGRKILVRDLPINLQNVLHVGRSRARTCFLDMLEKLRDLKLVTPLQQSHSSTPMITCAPTGQHPTVFDSASLEGNKGATSPSYWLFQESAPIYLWVASETDPPLWKTASVFRHQDGIDYWRNLQSACLNLEAAVNVQDTSGLETQSTNIGMAKSFRRAVSWRSEYFLTWHQTQYLKQFTEASGMSPLDIPDPNEKETKLSNICWVTSAPREVVENFYRYHKERLNNLLEKLRQKKKRTEEAKVSLARKSETARLQREHVWSDLLATYHLNEVPAPAALRIERIHKQFLHAGSIKDIDRWEKEIQAALRETDLASIKGLKISSRPSLPRPPPPTIQPSASQNVLSIENLIEMQGPPLEHDVPNRKRKTQQDNGVEVQKKGKRRHRFQWNPEFDELARDASVIIRARCRGLSRLDWGAFEQVFPAVPRNTVRQRLAHIKENPGNEAYLRRLEDVWHELWLKHRGTETLPDKNPHSPSKFDLINHIRFLRTHVDKHALRVGIPQTTEIRVPVIPASIEQIQQQYESIESERVAPDWDYIWNTIIEEGREKKLKRQPFSRICEKFSPPNLDSDEMVIAESAVKMAMGSPSEHYDSEQASLLLKSCGDEIIRSATKNLLSQGVLSKLQRDPKKLGPGRLLKISEANQNAIGGSISQDTYQDAVLLLEDMDPNDFDWHEWPLIATDGDCAALIQLVSENKVDFRINTSTPQAARPALDWNSKKADDDHIETMIRVQYHLESQEPEETSLRVEVNKSTPEATDGHGLNEEGVTACCRRCSTLGLVDCSACLDEAWNRLHDALDLNSRDTARELLGVLRQSKEQGTKKLDIINLFASSNTNLSVLLDRLLSADIPQVYWVGYKSLLLVSAHHIAKWGVAVSQNPLEYTFPRRWMDIKGRKVVDFWQAAIRAVMSTVIFRPGIPQSELRWRLRSVYDRQEIVDILGYLSREGYLCVRFEQSENLFSPYDEQEENWVYWFIGEKHWYQA